MGIRNNTKIKQLLAVMFCFPSLSSLSSFCNFVLTVANPSSNLHCSVLFSIIYYYNDNNPPNGCSGSFTQTSDASPGHTFIRSFTPDGNCTGNNVIAAQVTFKYFSTDGGSTYTPFNGGTAYVSVSNAVVSADCSGFLGTSVPINDGTDDDVTSLGDCGMPVWSVSKPYISLWLHDEPLGYQPAIGPRISFDLAFKQTETTAGLNTSVFSVGNHWNFPWFSFVSHDVFTNNFVHFPDGREDGFQGTNNFPANTRLVGDTTNGFTLSYPDGARICMASS